MIGRFYSRSISVLGFGLLGAAACASTETQEAKQPLPASFSELSGRKADLTKELVGVDKGIMGRCEISDGDCMMHVSDRRFELMSLHSFPMCDSAPNEEREGCEEREAAQQGMGEDVVRYYEQYNKCAEQILACTARLEAEAEEARKVALAEGRLKLLEVAGKCESEKVEALVAHESVKYLRSTLPPGEEEACMNLEQVTACEAALEPGRTGLQQLLRVEQSSYEEERAAVACQELRKQEATCAAPEIECLQTRAARYGATPDTERAFRHNREALKQRERYALRSDAASTERCLNDGVAKHQASIVQAYSIYTKQPVLYFRKKLHQAFLALHQDQAACLRENRGHDEPVARAAR